MLQNAARVAGERVQDFARAQEWIRPCFVGPDARPAPTDGGGGNWALPQCFRGQSAAFCNAPPHKKAPKRGVLRICAWRASGESGTLEASRLKLFQPKSFSEEIETLSAFLRYWLRRR